LAYWQGARPWAHAGYPNAGERCRLHRSQAASARNCRLTVDRGPMSALGPACVKTRASRECAELFSPFSSFDCDCQCGSFPIQRNRDKSSTRKFDVGVFTQAGSSTDLAAPKFDFCCSPESGLKSDIRPCPFRAKPGSGPPYSITSSARVRIAGGMSMPSSFAVLRLTTSSNLVGCTTGSSEGFSPLRMRPT
jgi:hypothetical protein